MEAIQTDNSLSWQKRDELGLLRAAFGCAKEVFSNPALSLVRLNALEDTGSSVFYVVLAGSIVACLWFVTPLLMYIPLQAVQLVLYGWKGLSHEMPGYFAKFGMLLLASPVFFALLPFCLAALYHAALRLFRTGPCGFSATLKIVNYVTGAWILSICVIPLVLMFFTVFCVVAFCGILGAILLHFGASQDLTQIHIVTMAAMAFIYVCNLIFSTVALFFHFHCCAAGFVSVHSTPKFRAHFISWLPVVMGVIMLIIFRFVF